MRIVRELGFEDSVDTLGRWMSHRIAELIHRAQEAKTDTEKEAAERECTEVILKVWERRKYWPQGQPLKDLSAFINTLTPDRYSSGRSESIPHELNWLDALPILQALLEKEETVVLNTAIADLELEHDQEWLDAHPDELSEEERRTITWLLERKQSFDSPYFSLGGLDVTNFNSMLSTERGQLALAALRRLEGERSKIISAIEKALEHTTTEQT